MSLRCAVRDCDKEAEAMGSNRLLMKRRINRSGGKSLGGEQDGSHVQGFKQT